MTAKPIELSEGTSDSPAIWLLPCWDDWYRGGSSSYSIDESQAARAYGHWHLAVELATDGADDIRLGTAIQKLWNAVEARARLLHSEYRLGELKKVMGWSREKPDLLELLARIGLARPLILRELKDIRNAVEHADRGAPSLASCQRYIDSVWYFLRSTDIFASRRVRSFDLEATWVDEATKNEHPVFIEFDFGGRDWMPHIRGRFPTEFVLGSGAEGAIEVRLDKPLQKIGAELVFLSGSIAVGSPAAKAALREYFLVDLPDNGRAAA